MILYVDDLETEKRITQALSIENVVNLTPTEYKILSLLLKKDGEIVTKEEILHELGREIYLKKDDDNIISVHICQLRKKIKSGKIETVRLKGYRFLK